MAKSNTLREQLISDLRNAHAMELQLVEALDAQVNATENYPSIQSRVREHLDETRMHAQRMEECLNAYNESPSSLKSLGAKASGAAHGVKGSASDHALEKMAREDYMNEHMEIATYLVLITEAQALGDTQTTLAAQTNMRDEVRMADWLEQHMAEAVVLSLKEDGYTIDDSRIPELSNVTQSALHMARSGLTSGSGATGQRNDMTNNTMPPATGLGWNPDRARQSEASTLVSGYEATSDRAPLVPPDDEGYPSSTR